jgi:hypothetical protein
MQMVHEFTQSFPGKSIYISIKNPFFLLEKRIFNILKEFFYKYKTSFTAFITSFAFGNHFSNNTGE